MPSLPPFKIQGEWKSYRFATSARSAILTGKPVSHRQSLGFKINDSVDSVLGVGAAPCVNAGITAGNLSSNFDTARLGKMRRSD